MKVLIEVITNSQLGADVCSNSLIKLSDIDVDYVRLKELPSESEMITAFRRRSEVEFTIILLFQVCNGSGRGDILEPLVLDLPLLDELLLLVLSLLLLNLEVHVDLILFRDVNVSKFELLQIEVMSSQMTLLALKHNGVVLIVGKLVAKLDHVDSACHDGTNVNRALRTWEKVSVLVSNVGI